MRRLTFEEMEMTNAAGGHFWEDLACSISGGLHGAIVGAFIGGPVGFVSGLLVGSLLSVGCSAGVHMND